MHPFYRIVVNTINNTAYPIMFFITRLLAPPPVTKSMTSLSRKSDHHQHRAFHCPTYGHWEYDSAIVLGRNAIQRLKVSQLKISIIKLKFEAAELN